MKIAWYGIIGLAGLALFSACAGSTGKVRHPSEAVDTEGEIQTREALVQWELGEVEQARTLLQGVLERYPGYFRARRLLQEINLDEKGVEQTAALAAERLERLRNPMNLTLAARVAEDPEEKIRLLEEALRIDSTYVWAHYGIAFVYLKEERLSEYERAREHLELALSHAPGLTAARKLLIENLHLLGEYIPLDEQYRIYLAREPDDLDARYNYADLLQSHIEDPEEALRQIERVLDREPDRLDALFLKAHLLYQSGEVSMAETVYHDLASRHPNALLNLAILYRDAMDDSQRALDYFQRYLDYTGENAEEKNLFDQEILVPNLIEALGKEGP